MPALSAMPVMPCKGSECPSAGSEVMSSTSTRRISIPTSMLDAAVPTGQEQTPLAVYRPSSTNVTAIVVPLLLLLVISTGAVYWFFRRRPLSPPDAEVTPAMRLADWFTHLASPQKRGKVRVVEVKSREVKRHEIRSDSRDRKESVKESKKGRKTPPVIDLRAAIEAGKKAAKASEESYRRSKSRSEQKSQSIRLSESKPRERTSKPPEHHSEHAIAKPKEKQKKPPSLLLAPLSPRAWRAQPSAHTNRWSRSRPSTRGTSSFFCAGPSPSPLPAVTPSAFTEVSTVFSEAEIKSVKKIRVPVPALPVRKIASVEGRTAHDALVADHAKEQGSGAGLKEED